MIMMECRTTKTYLHLRRVQETLSGGTHKYIMDILVNFLEVQSDEIIHNFDLIYRVNSAFAEQKNLPRDVIVQLLMKRMKEEILRKHYKNPLEIDGKRIKIMKELPKKLPRNKEIYVTFSSNSPKRHLVLFAGFAYPLSLCWTSASHELT